MPHDTFVCTCGQHLRCHHAIGCALKGEVAMNNIDLQPRRRDADKFIESIEATYRSGVDLIRRKNADYASVGDPFKNFRSAGIAGVSVERAILVRTLDKMARISNLLGRDAAVLDEKIEDTLLDCINYLAILKAYMENKRPTPLP